MKRLALAVSAAIALSLVIALPSSAAIKAGSACKKAGQKTIDSGRTYTCVKQGKKFAWNKGVVIKAAPAKVPVPTPTPSPSATPTATPMPTPSPTPTFTPPVRPTSFGDLLEKIDGVSYWAWATSAEKIKNASEPSIEVEVLIGPNTPVIEHNTLKAVRLVSKLYSGAPTPKKVVAIYFSYEDRAWGQSTFGRYGYRASGNETVNMCQTPLTCWGGMAEIDYKGTGILLMGVNDLTRIDKDHSSGPLQAHEFAHTFQLTQFLGNPKEFNTYCCVKQYLPWWTVEGGAHFVEASAMNPDSYEGYKAWMAKSVSDFKGNDRETFTKAWFENFLQPADTSLWGTEQYRWKIYSGGALVEQIFVALKGPDISMKLMNDVATGLTWPDAFEKNFGISWSTALPILSETLVAMIAKS
jgi:hypothetical protein